MRALLGRIFLFAGWVAVVTMLALWLAEAVHRGHAAGEWIVGVGLAGAIVVPIIAARLRT